MKGKMLPCCAGNIGTKISLLMVERGAKVLLTKNNFYKLKKLLNLEFNQTNLH